MFLDQDSNLPSSFADSEISKKMHKEIFQLAIICLQSRVLPDALQNEVHIIYNEVHIHAWGKFWVLNPTSISSIIVH